MNKAEIIKQVDFMISVGFFKIEDSIKVLQFRSDLEEMGVDIVINNPEKAHEVVKKTETIEKKVTKPNPFETDSPF